MKPKATRTRTPSEARARERFRARNLKAVARGDMRRNLDGSEAGPPTEDEREQARRDLAERDQRKLERIQRQQQRMRTAVNDAA
jgi:sRNA-binding protein